jgi:glycosyltransferase involved in cell wall biosynthesis
VRCREVRCSVDPLFRGTAFGLCPRHPGVRIMSASTSLRILLVGDTISPHVPRLAGGLARDGHTVFVLNGAHLVDRVAREHGATIHGLAYDEVRFRGNHRMASVARMELRWNEHRLRRLIARARIDVIHVNNLYCGERLDRVAFAPRLPAPIVATAWGSDVDDGAVAKHPDYAPLRQAVLSRATLVTGDSGPMLARCRGFVPGRAADDFRLVRWLPDVRTFNPAVAERGRRAWRERLGLSDEAPMILSHRNTRPNYRIDRIIRAFGQAFGGDPQTACSRAPVLVVKSMRPCDDAHAAHIESLRRLAEPLGDRVRFIDEVPFDEVASLFGAADLAIGIPEADGAPASIPELMALGVPMIVGDLADYVGLVQHAANAWVVDASADEPVAAAMRRLIGDAALRRCIREGALAAASDLGTFDVTVAGFVQCYRHAIMRWSDKRQRDVA